MCMKKLTGTPGVRLAERLREPSGQGTDTCVARSKAARAIRSWYRPMHPYRLPCEFEQSMSGSPPTIERERSARIAKNVARLADLIPEDLKQYFNRPRANKRAARKVASPPKPRQRHDRAASKRGKEEAAVAAEAAGKKSRSRLPSAPFVHQVTYAPVRGSSFETTMADEAVPEALVPKQLLVKLFDSVFGRAAMNTELFDQVVDQLLKDGWGIDEMRDAGAREEIAKSIAKIVTVPGDVYKFNKFLSSLSAGRHSIYLSRTTP